MRTLCLLLFVLCLGVDGYSQTKTAIQVKEWRDGELATVLATLKKINECMIPGMPAYTKESPPTRAEAARICIGFYRKIRGDYDRLDKSLKALTKQLDEKSSKAELQALKDELAALSDQTDYVKNAGRALNLLRTSIRLFRREIIEDGLDYEQVLKDIDDLAPRRNPLDYVTPLVDLHAYLSTGIIDLSSHEGHGASLSGRLIDHGHDTQAWSEGLLIMEMKKDYRHSFYADLEISNLVGAGALADSYSDNPIRTGDEAAWFRRLEVKLMPEAVSPNIEFSIGRMNLFLTEEIFRKPYPEPLAYLWRGDENKWIIDGARIELGTYPYSGSVFVGQKDSRLTTASTGDQIEEMRVGRFGSPWNTSAPGYQRPRGLIDTSAANMEVNDIIGATLKWNDLDCFEIEGSYLSLNSRQDALVEGKLSNRLDIYSVEAKADVGDWTFGASYNQSALMGKGTDVVSRENEFISASAKVDADEVEAKLDYRQIGANYSAPGDWGRIGMWWNPVDIEGLRASLKARLDDRTDLKLTAEAYRGIDDSISNWGHSQKVNRVVLASIHSFGNGMNATIEQEWVEYRDGKGPKPTENWTTVSLFYNINASMAAQLAWQYGAYDSKGLSRFMIDGSRRLSGSTIAAQVMYKF